jgi:hypothetical protein
MKAALWGLAALAIGIAAGIGLTRREFAHEVVPVDLTAVSAASGSNATVKIGPKVTIVNGERHDFGTMDRNSHGTHAFIVRNDGDAPLTLTTGQPSCGVCIKVFSVANESLKPGEKTEVKIEWNVTTSDAEFEQSGPLNTNDSNRPTVHLSLHGHVLDSVRTDRSDVHFHDLSATESATAAVNIYAFRDAELKIEKAEFNKPEFAKHFDISFTPLTSDDLAREPKAKGGQKMQIEVKPGLPYGDFNEPLSISTNQAPEPLTVHVIGNVASDILLVGPNLTREKSLVNLGTVSQKEGKQHTLFLIVKGPHRDDTKVEIESFEPKVDFSARLGEPIHDTPRTIRYPIVIEIPAGAAPVTRLDGAKIHIVTTHPDVKELNIKVRYVVKE